MTIDDKLREILTATVTYKNKEWVEFTASDEAITQLKQAFEDDGYLKPLYARKETIDSLKHPKMTGQEWFDRFEKGLTSFKDSKFITVTNDKDWMVLEKAYNRSTRDAIEAAKKASGLK